MKLEEAINNLKKLVELRKNKSNVKYDTCICGTKDLETLLQALENKDKQIKELKALNKMQEYKMQEYRINEMDIPKKKIEDKIKEIRKNKKFKIEAVLPPHTFGVVRPDMGQHVVESLMTIDEVENILLKLLEV